MEETKKSISKWRKGWELAKSSMYVLKLDKELVLLPLMGFFISVSAMFAFMVGLFVSLEATTKSTFGTSFEANLGWQGVLFGLVFAIIITIISNFFLGALTHGALERFRGNDPTVKSSLKAAWSRKGPLALYSLFMAVIGFTLGQLEQRLPFAGKIAVWLLGAAWNIANIFAIPVIMTDSHRTMPLDATRRSVGVIKKVWGEGVVAQLSLLAISLLLLFGWIGLALGGVAIGVVLNVGVWIAIAGGVVAFLALFGIILFLGTIGTITRVAVFYYATTGNSPEHFNKDLLRDAFTPKKARKIFA